MASRPADPQTAGLAKPSSPAHHWLRLLASILALAALVTALFGVAQVRRARRSMQVQTDPQVATAWLIGVTHGNAHLARGGSLQKWANAHNIRLFGEYLDLAPGSQVGTDGMELWFDCESYVRKTPDLECHRIYETAFTDDLGQQYHGFLDFHGHLVGVCLPGYDHRSRRIFCDLHWMPRGKRWPCSTPMHFTVDLPPARRLLPPRSSLPDGPVSVTHVGVTVTVSNVRLSPAFVGANALFQREMLFDVTIRGGGPAWPQAEIWDSKETIFRITDPYGVPLIPGGVMGGLPPTTMDVLDATNKGSATAGKPRGCIVPVEGAGAGTDVVTIHFDLRPTGGAETVPFDLVAPVKAGN
jgi:hypothetical protein